MITNKFELEKCEDKIPYSIIHNPIPLEMGPDLSRAIEYLLWYVPDISSIQSKDNEMVSNYLYDEFTFEEIARYMNIGDKDVLFTENIPKEIEDFYKGSICPHEQKLVITRGQSETKTSSTLRHIRNAIAHGSFTVVENLLIGFDYKVNQSGKEECKAIFKIKPENLLKALENLDTELTTEKLVKRALENCGYKVEHWTVSEDAERDFDLSAQKDGRRYAIEIRKSGSEFNTKDNFLDHLHIEKLVSLFEGLSRVNPILIINEGLLSEFSKDYLLDHSVIIMDPKNIKKLLAGRDILGEIVRDNRIKKVKKNED
ncbi:hypothetical protein [Peptoniphilus catoniae]|uniref:hypothetical protein n=1 Tax=Peptoniphilus catoniae TaxID=1660341 RepID=UPI0010FED067|nr:hypothetical protein [Peptoniphilus catoniae]